MTPCFYGSGIRQTSGGLTEDGHHCALPWVDAFYGGMSPGELGGGTITNIEVPDIAVPAVKRMSLGVNPAVRRAVYANLTPAERAMLGVPAPGDEPGRGM